MSNGIEFDQDRVAAIERIYRTSSMTERRRRIREALALAPGEHVLSIGTGPGFETRGLAEAVGEHGRVDGLDTAKPMLAVARERCADQPWVSFYQGDATDVPVPDGTFDAAAAVQVYEYVPDVDAALAELYRTLRYGGRAVVFDSDWSTMTYHTENPTRSERILDAFDTHCPHPRLARTLKPRLERVGFEVTDQDVYVHFETSLTEDAVGGAFIPPIKRVVTEEGHIDESEAEAWGNDIRERAGSGEYFFTFNQYLFVVEKPDTVP